MNALVKSAKDAARQRVSRNANSTPGFVSAFYHGSTNGLPDDTHLSATSDVDVRVVVGGHSPPHKPGTFSYHGVPLEVAYLSSAQLRSPEIVLS